MYPLQVKNALRLTLITLALLCSALFPLAHAVSPPPDGDYPGGNTAEGHHALLSRTTGAFDTAIGWESLTTLNAGSFNVGVGAGTLALNNGDSNTAAGTGALLLNMTGMENAATGAFALLFNDSGSFNTANGAHALQANTTGDNNTASGRNALIGNTMGIQNTAGGVNALASNTTGNANIALGFFAGASLTTGSNNIDIGHPGFADEHDTIRIGNTNHIAAFIDGVYAVNQGVPALPVFVSSGGQLGTTASSRRFKNEIKPMAQTSEAILALEPVTFHYNNDKTKTPQFGLVAEDVEQVNPDLVVRGPDGKPYTVRYDAVNAMLLNEFLKEHRKVQKLEAALEGLSKHLKEQDTEIQRVNDELQLTRRASQMANNNQ